MLIEIFTPQSEDLLITSEMQKFIILVKALSILKLLRYVKNLDILAKGLRQSLASFAFLILTLLMANFIFGLMVYYVELSDPQSQFRAGIPKAMWWCIVTMTTVGYGDIIPITAGGKIIGGFVGLFGMMLLALPVVILGYHFQDVYNEREDREAYRKSKRH